MLCVVCQIQLFLIFFNSESYMRPFHHETGPYKQPVSKKTNKKSMKSTFILVQVATFFNSLGWPN